MKNDLTEINKLNAIKNVFLAGIETPKKPTFLVVTGTIGTGKTTFRKEQLNNYVQIDYADILALIKEQYPNSKEIQDKYTLIIMNMLIQDALFQRKNIAIEILGNDSESLLKIIEVMKKYEYTTSLQHLKCPPEISKQRHEKALADKDYLSAYFTQESIINLLYNRLGLGEYISKK